MSSTKLTPQDFWDYRDPLDSYPEPAPREEPETPDSQEGEGERPSGFRELTTLLGPLVGPLLRGADGGLDRSKVKAKSFEEFRSFLQTQVSIDNKSFNQYDVQIFGKKIGISGYHKVLGKKKYEPLLRLLYEEGNSPSLRAKRGNPGGPASSTLKGLGSASDGIAAVREPDLAMTGLNHLLQEFTAEIIDVSAETFVRHHMGTQEGRARLGGILQSSSYFNPDIKADLLKAIASVGKSQGIAEEHWDGIDEEIDTWNYWNFSVTEGEIDRATGHALEILAAGNQEDDQVAAIRKKYSESPEQVQTPTTADISPAKVREIFSLHQEKQLQTDLLSQTQSKLANFWLLLADNENWSGDSPIATEDHRARLLTTVQDLLGEAELVVSDRGLEKLNQRVQAFLHGAVTGEGSEASDRLAHFFKGHGLEELFEEIPQARKAAYLELKQFSDEIHHSLEMGQTISFQGPQLEAQDDKTHLASTQFIQGLQQLKRSLWYQYKQHKALSRGISNLAEGFGVGDLVDIQGASQKIDQIIAEVQKASCADDLKAQVSELYDSMKGEGVLHRAMAAAEMDGIEQAIGLGQTVLIIIGTTLATKGLGTLAAIANAAKNTGTLVNAARTVGALKNIGSAAGQAAQTSALVARAKYGFKMGAWISFAENSVALSTGEVRTEADHFLKWSKDSLATGLAMGFFTPLAAQAGYALERNVVQRLLDRYFTGGVRGLERFAGDTVLEGMEEIVDATLRYKMDGGVGGLTWDQFREITVVSTAGGGTKVGAVATAFRQSQGFSVEGAEDLLSSRGAERRGDPAALKGQPLDSDGIAATPAGPRNDTNESTWAGQVRELLFPEGFLGNLFPDLRPDLVLMAAAAGEPGGMGNMGIPEKGSSSSPLVREVNNDKKPLQHRRNRIQKFQQRIRKAGDGTPIIYQALQELPEFFKHSDERIREIAMMAFIDAALKVPEGRPEITTAIQWVEKWVQQKDLSPTIWTNIGYQYSALLNRQGAEEGPPLERTNEEGIDSVPPKVGHTGRTLRIAGLDFSVIFPKEKSKREIIFLAPKKNHVGGREYPKKIVVKAGRNRKISLNQIRDLLAPFLVHYEGDQREVTRQGMRINLYPGARSGAGVPVEEIDGARSSKRPTPPVEAEVPASMPPPSVHPRNPKKDLALILLARRGEKLALEQAQNADLSFYGENAYAEPHYLEFLGNFARLGNLQAFDFLEEEAQSNLEAVLLLQLIAQENKSSPLGKRAHTALGKAGKKNPRAQQAFDHLSRIYSQLTDDTEEPDSQESPGGFSFLASAGIGLGTFLTPDQAQAAAGLSEAAQMMPSWGPLGVVLGLAAGALGMVFIRRARQRRGESESLLDQIQELKLVAESGFQSPEEKFEFFIRYLKLSDQVDPHIEKHPQDQELVQEGFGSLLDMVLELQIPSITREDLLTLGSRKSEKQEDYIFLRLFLQLIEQEHPDSEIAETARSVCENLPARRAVQNRDQSFINLIDPSELFDEFEDSIDEQGLLNFFDRINTAAAEKKDIAVLTYVMFLMKTRGITGDPTVNHWLSSNPNPKIRRSFYAVLLEPLLPHHSEMVPEVLDRYWDQEQALQDVNLQDPDPEIREDALGIWALFERGRGDTEGNGPQSGGLGPSGMLHSLAFGIGVGTALWAQPARAAAEISEAAGSDGLLGWTAGLSALLLGAVIGKLRGKRRSKILSEQGETGWSEMYRELEELEFSVNSHFDSPEAHQRFFRSLYLLDKRRQDLSQVDSEFDERIQRLIYLYRKNLIPQITSEDLQVLSAWKMDSEHDHETRLYFFGFINDEHPLAEIRTLAGNIIGIKTPENFSNRKIYEIYEHWINHRGVGFFLQLIDEGLQQGHFRNVVEAAEFLLDDQGRRATAEVRNFFREHPHPLVRLLYYQAELLDSHGDRKLSRLAQLWVLEHRRIQGDPEIQDPEHLSWYFLLADFFDRAFNSRASDLAVDVESLIETKASPHPGPLMGPLKKITAFGLGLSTLLGAETAHAAVQGAAASGNTGLVLSALGALCCIPLAMAFGGRRAKSKSSQNVETEQAMAQLEELSIVGQGVFETGDSFYAYMRTLVEFQNNLPQDQQQDVELGTKLKQIHQEVRLKVLPQITLKQFRELLPRIPEFREANPTAFFEFFTALAENHGNFQVQNLAAMVAEWEPNQDTIPEEFDSFYRPLLQQYGWPHLMNLIGITSLQGRNWESERLSRLLVEPRGWLHNEKLLRALYNHPNPIVRGIYYQAALHEVKIEDRTKVLVHFLQTEETRYREDLQSGDENRIRNSQRLRRYFLQVRDSQGKDLSLSFADEVDSGMIPQGGMGSVGPLAAAGIGLATLLQSSPVRAMEQALAENPMVEDPGFWSQYPWAFPVLIGLGLFWAVHSLIRSGRMAKLAEGAKEGEGGFRVFKSGAKPGGHQFKFHLAEIAEVNPEGVFYLDELRKKYPDDPDYRLLLRSLLVVHLQKQAVEDPRALEALELLAYRDNPLAQGAHQRIMAEREREKKVLDSSPRTTVSHSELGMGLGMGNFFGGSSQEIGTTLLEWAPWVLIPTALVGGTLLLRYGPTVWRNYLAQKAGESDRALESLLKWADPESPQGISALGLAAEKNPQAVLALQQLYEEGDHPPLIHQKLRTLSTEFLQARAEQEPDALEALLVLCRHDNRIARGDLRNLKLDSYRGNLEGDWDLVHQLLRLHQQTGNPAVPTLLSQIEADTIWDRVEKDWRVLALLHLRAIQGNAKLRARLQQFELFPIVTELSTREFNDFIERVAVPLALLGNRSALNILQTWDPAVTFTLDSKSKLTPGVLRSVALLSEWENNRALNFLAHLAQAHPWAAFYLARLASEGHFGADQRLVYLDPKYLHRDSEKSFDHLMALVNLGEFGNQMAAWAVKVHLGRRPEDSQALEFHGEAGYGYKKVRTAMTTLWDRLVNISPRFRNMEPDIQGALINDLWQEWNATPLTERNSFFDEDHEYNFTGPFPLSFALAYLRSQGLKVDDLKTVQKKLDPNLDPPQEETKLKSGIQRIPEGPVPLDDRKTPVPNDNKSGGSGGKVGPLLALTVGVGTLLTAAPAEAATTVVASLPSGVGLSALAGFLSLMGLSISAAVLTRNKSIPKTSDTEEDGSGETTNFDRYVRGRLEEFQGEAGYLEFIQKSPDQVQWQDLSYLEVSMGRALEQEDHPEFQKRFNVLFKTMMELESMPGLDPETFHYLHGVRNGLLFHANSVWVEAYGRALEDSSHNNLDPMPYFTMLVSIERQYPGTPLALEARSRILAFEEKREEMITQLKKLVDTMDPQEILTQVDLHLKNRQEGKLWDLIQLLVEKAMQDRDLDIQTQLVTHPHPMVRAYTYTFVTGAGTGRPGVLKGLWKPQEEKVLERELASADWMRKKGAYQILGIMAANGVPEARARLAEVRQGLGKPSESPDAN